MAERGGEGRGGIGTRPERKRNGKHVRGQGTSTWHLDYLRYTSELTSREHHVLKSCLPPCLETKYLIFCTLDFSRSSTADI